MSSSSIFSTMFFIDISINLLLAIHASLMAAVPTSLFRIQFCEASVTAGEISRNVDMNSLGGRLFSQPPLQTRLHPCQCLQKISLGPKQWSDVVGNPCATFVKP